MHGSAHHRSMLECSMKRGASCCSMAALRARFSEHEGEPLVIQDLVVSARIRMPPTHVIELMKALERQLSTWETETGRLAPLEPPHPDL